MLVARAVSAALSIVITAALAGGCGTAAPATGASERIKIAFLLPDVQATRYERFDVPYLVRKVKSLCARCEVVYRNAAELPGTQQHQAAEALDKGVDVLILDPVDAVAARRIVEAANRRKVPVIAYDRLVEDADLDYYVSFDSENIGRLQAAALVQRLLRMGVDSGRIVMINGSQTDNNAMLFNKGARSVLDRTSFETVPQPDYFVPGWSPDTARTFMADQLTLLAAAPGGGAPVGVYAANDGLASGAITALKAAGVLPLPPVTGQDAELAAVQRVLVGDQYMTVHKNYREQAERTAEFAVDLAHGRRPRAPGTVDNGREDVPTVLVGVVTITRENLQQAVLDSGIYTREEVCAGEFAAACAAAGLR